MPYKSAAHFAIDEAIFFSLLPCATSAKQNRLYPHKRTNDRRCGLLKSQLSIMPKTTISREIISSAILLDIARFDVPRSVKKLAALK